LKRDHCILMVEDSPDDALLIERAMRRAGVQCPLHIVADGDVAVRYIEGVEPYADRYAYPLPTLVLLDLKLPRRSGFEVLEHIRANAALARTIVVVLTSSGQQIDVDRAYAGGANSYLVKPIKPKAMDDLALRLNQYWLDANCPPSRISPAASPPP